MNPILLSTSVFIILEGTHHFSPSLAFGIAIGGALTSALLLWLGRSALALDNEEGRRGEG
ncbi:hypothetical protein [Methylobacterium bullatum]|nr:hypothetical protein [Methylobacterium bullatum]MBD8900772.1 hypothetical protein [Methylobacterium bullatum]